jgi:hypothetical protein
VLGPVRGQAHSGYVEALFVKLDVQLAARLVLCRRIVD